MQCNELFKKKIKFVSSECVNAWLHPRFKFYSKEKLPKLQLSFLQTINYLDFLMQCNLCVCYVCVLTHYVGLNETVFFNDLLNMIHNDDTHV